VAAEQEALAPGELRFGALLSPPGRLLFDLFLWGEADAVMLDVAADRRDALLQRLAMYRLRAQVIIEPDERPVLATWGGALPAAACRAPHGRVRSAHQQHQRLQPGF
jgi:folate-binding Fe-S cluster repair protein YgfZ